MLLWATKPMNTGRSFATDFRRFMAYRTTGTTSPTDITSDYVNRFGPSSPSKKIFLWAELLNLNTGTRSVKLVTNTTTPAEVDNVYTIQTQLTANQILSLNTTPALLIPAPPPGNAILLHGASYSYTYVTTPYTCPPTVEIAIGYGPNCSPECIDDHIQDELSATQNYLDACLSTNTIHTPTTNLNNTPIYARTLQAVTNGDGTIQITCLYSIIAVP
jgi:hypothetical protein